MRRLLCVVLMLALAGCAAWEDGPAYWWQSVAGEIDLLYRAQPVARLVDDPATSPALRTRLRQAIEIREFASRELGLPDNASYTRYTALDRPFVVWNVFAAPALSLELHQWCFPVAGCVSYRGYFARADAERFAQRMRDEGLAVYVAGVPAFSTLGWFDDPLLSTFIMLPEPQLARLIFHELAHQRLYLKGATMFNESWATTVEQVGVARWLAAREAAGGDPALRKAWQLYLERRAQFIALLTDHRQALARLFAEPLSDADKAAGRDRIFAQLREDYEQLKRQWGGYTGYDRWFSQPLNTAQLASVATYTQLVPAFEALLAREDGNLPRFYEAVARLADLPEAQRKQALAALAPH